MDFVDLLPVGSVVTIFDVEKKVMIIGYKGIRPDEPEREYDYIGCIYPMGINPDAGDIIFDHEAIMDVVYTGYSNRERIEIMKVLDDIYETAKKDEPVQEKEDN